MAPVVYFQNSKNEHSFYDRRLLNLKTIRTFSQDSALVDERRAHIVRCTADIFVQKGYHGTTLPEITKACRMSAGALYHYVGSKEDMLYLVMEAAVKRVRKRLVEALQRCDGLSATDTLRELLRELVEINDDEQDSLLMLNRDLRHLHHSARQVLLDGQMNNISFIEDILKEGIKADEFDIDDPFLVAHTIVQDCAGWALQRWYLRSRYTVAQFTNYIVSSTMKAVCSGKTLQKN